MFRWMAFLILILVATGCGSTGLVTPGSGRSAFRTSGATDVEITMSCSDGIQNIETNLSVNLLTLGELRSAIESMTLYPAGLTCSLTQTGLLGASVVVAQAASGPKDFAVGGGHLTIGDDCINFGLSAHSDAADNGTERLTQVNGNPTNVNGSLVVHPENCDPTTGQADSHSKSRVTCLSVTTLVPGLVFEARGVAKIEQARGAAATACGGPCTHVLWTATDNGNPSSGAPPDMLGFNFLGSDPGNLPGCHAGTGQVPVAKGNITIRDN